MTLLEMLITTVLVATLAAVAMPLMKHTGKRTQELELRARLRELRTAIDVFRQDWARDGEVLTGPLCVNSKLACKDVSGVTGYPKTLDALLGVQLTGSEAVRREPVKRYLRRIPLDPLTGHADWALRCHRDPPTIERWCEEDVFDVSSTSRGEALDGSRYRDW
jgi:general secretion pathway protein G